MRFFIIYWDSIIVYKLRYSFSFQSDMSSLKAGLLVKCWMFLVIFSMSQFHHCKSSNCSILFVRKAFFDFLGWISSDNTVWGYIFGDGRVATDDCAISYCDTWHDGRIVANPYVIPDDGISFAWIGFSIHRVLPCFAKDGKGISTND